jgi:hypothetical protein
MNFDPVLAVLFLVAIIVFVWLDVRKKPSPKHRPHVVGEAADLVFSRIKSGRSHLLLSVTMAGAVWVERNVTSWTSVHDGAIEIDDVFVDNLIVRANYDGLRVVVH